METSQGEQTPASLTTPEMRGATLQQIVVNGLRTSHEIATALDLRHTVVVRMLERFEAVGALHAVYLTAHKDSLTIIDSSLSARFQDLAIPLW